MHQQPQAYRNSKQLLEVIRYIAKDEQTMKNEDDDLTFLMLSSYLLLAKVQRAVIPFRNCQPIPQDAIVALNEAALVFEKDWMDINKAMRERRNHPTGCGDCP